MRCESCGGLMWVDQYYLQADCECGWVTELNADLEEARYGNPEVQHVRYDVKERRGQMSVVCVLNETYRGRAVGPVGEMHVDGAKAEALTNALEAMERGET